MTALTPEHTLLFDLDGTLVDNFDAIFAAYAHTQQTLGLPPATYEKVRATVGGSVPVTMRRLLGDAFREDAIAVFNAHFRQNFREGLRLLPGVLPLLENLANLPGGRPKMAVFTNKNHEMSQEVCAHLGITEFFLTIEGSERPEGYRKPNRDFSEFILHKLQADPARTIMIGDSPFDEQAARVVNIPTVYLVATGSHTRQELADQTDAESIFPDMIELAREVFDFRV